MTVDDWKQLDKQVLNSFKRNSPMISAQHYSDPEVAAALNSCFDLEKWRLLPEKVRKRAKELLCHHRLKPVCFFDDEGFGLRVYVEKVVVDTQDDECTEVEGVTQNQVDVHGHWMRCPGDKWNPKVTYLIMGLDGRNYWCNGIKTNRPDYLDGDDDGDDDTEDGDSTPQKKIRPRWVGARGGATPYEKEEAEKVAAEVKGIVILNS